MTDMNDKAKRLEQVLRYLNAETTIEEEQLLLDYYTHTEEELSPEEEDVRLLLIATNAHSHQEELSIQKEKEFDQLMQPFCKQDKEPRNHRQWLYPVFGAVAASLLLLLLLHHPTADTEQTKVTHQLAEKQTTRELAQKQPSQQPAPSQEKESSPVEKLTPETSEVKLNPEPQKQLARHHEKAEQETPIPDTLGNGIWKSEKNVLTALKMLADCEATIQREEQEMRNDIIQATFRATPQPAGVLLVSNEAGDYEVIDPKNIIDI